MRKTSFLFMLGLTIAIVIASYMGYLFWQSSKVDDEFLRSSSLNEDLLSKIDQFEREDIIESISAKEMLGQLKKNTVQWSKVIKKINSSIPRDRNGDFIVEVLSYSGSQSKTLSMSMKTMPDSDKPYFDVATLIKAFDESKYFTENFVPSISSGFNEQGKEVLSFVLNTNYIDSLSSSPESLETSLGQILEDSLDEESSVESELIIR